MTYTDKQSISHRVRTYFKQNIVTSLLGTAVSIFAVYLSWTCNTKQDENVVLKVIYALFAFIFNIFYLIYYYLFRRSSCL